MVKKNEKQPVKKKKNRGRLRKKDPITVVQESIRTGEDLPQIQRLRQSGIVKITETKTELPTTVSEIEDWRKNLTKQIDDLTKQLKIIDVEYFKTQKQLASIELDRKKILKKQASINKKITNEQNIVFKAEDDLQKVITSVYTADIPDFIRPLFRWMPFLNKDEIDLKTKIAQTEAKIYQRKSILVDISGELAQIMVAAQCYQNTSEIISAVAESSRSARADLGKIRREFDLKFQESTNRTEQNRVISNYVETMKHLNEIKGDFQESVITNKKITQSSFNSLSKLSE